MNDMLNRAALSLSDFPISILAKGTLIMALSLLAVRCARRAPASMRHLILASAFAVLAALPLAEAIAPPISVPVARQQPALFLGPIVVHGDVDSTAVSGSPLRAPDAGTARDGGRGIPSTSTLISIAWAIGAAVCLVPVVLTPWRLRRLRRTARRWDAGDALVKARGPGSSRATATLFVHDEVTAPLTCGILKPAIVLPADAPQWSHDELRRALVHEMEHIRRADWLIYLATRSVCALYWFHPLAWIAWRRLSLESERVCDDAVLRVAERTEYAQQLVTLARRHVEASPFPVLSMAGRSDLSWRVTSLLDDTQARGCLSARRATAIVAAATLLVAAVAPLRAALQNPQAALPADVQSFDVVSVRENKSGEMTQSSRRQPGRIVMTNLPLRTFVLSAFGLQPQQLAGGPDWIDTARYDVTAQFSSEFPVTEPGTVGPLNLMMQRVLAERFNLAVHRETRDLPIYTLTVARKDGKLGPKITTAATDCQAVMNALLKNAAAGGPPPAPPQLPDGRPACGMRFGPAGRLIAGGTSMAAFARIMSVPAGRLVVDRTGLPGGYDFEVEYAPDSASAPGAPPASADSNLPSLFTALDEQLGLKLEPQRGPVEVLVIDRVERPTEN